MELEEQYHEPDDLACISVFNEEVEYCKLMIKKYEGKDEESFFEGKLDTLEYNKEDLETQVEKDIIKMEDYKKSINRALV